MQFEHTYAQQLPGAYAAVQAAGSPQPELLKLNTTLAGELNLDIQWLESEQGLAFLAGNTLPDSAQPIAQVYAGHQFGGFSAQLGDGRALLVGELLDVNAKRRDLAFKGSGRTPFSRGGDGKAAIGPVLREYLISEAMHALGIPSTRILAAVATGASVQREQRLPGALLTRIAASHIRVGTFQYFAAKGDVEGLRRLADYTIARHYPELIHTSAAPLGTMPSALPSDSYAKLLRAVCAKQAALVADWMSIGFIHGVMNTDNMTLSGETIDYGPCAFMEAYHPDTVFSSIDTHGRYAYGNQPGIAQWNLARLAEAMLGLFTEAQLQPALDEFTTIVQGFSGLYAAHWLQRFRAKLGLDAQAELDESDKQLIDAYLSMLEEQKIDFTLAFRYLSNQDKLLTLCEDPAKCQQWLSRWSIRRQNNLGKTSDLDLINPAVIPRNHLVEEALEQATQTMLQGRVDLSTFNALLARITRPMQAAVDTNGDAEIYNFPAAPEITRCYQTFCGT